MRGVGSGGGCRVGGCCGGGCEYEVEDIRRRRWWGSEADLINDLATNIMGLLALTPSNEFDDFVGIEPRVTEMKTMLSLQTKEVKVIGIWGPAGIGKTTAARVLYDQVSPKFQLSTFLENIKGSFERPCGSNDRQLKLRFQEKLLSQIFNQKDIVFATHTNTTCGAGSVIHSPPLNETTTAAQATVGESSVTEPHVAVAE
uniref:NB-ARC domain-containing protein n=1 Tax=Brassica oleracea var. oleracea TaxID=109376 RepID=A0A0D3E6C2_BRAOL